MGRKNGQAHRGGNERPAMPAWAWVLCGVVLGLALSAIALYKDWVPVVRERDAPRPNPQATPSDAVADPGVANAPAKPKYDFYTVLPEMEVVIPESQVSAEAARPEPPTEPGARYFLQTGSFRSDDDAEQMKARLALLGLRAQVVTVDINAQTWHRVRVGPYVSARELDDARRTLSSNGFEAIALKEAAR
ncbi:MAG TPA: SPOR domain-containing protein [Candidatus Saccharimonadia bacterium]|nr:SPOR domain-containing protein [Candidatus Saccharimonadia bacterium]